VPVNVELEVIRYVIGGRVLAVKADPGLLTWERWNHSKVFYDSRTWLNQHNWDTTIYNDQGIGRKRKDFYSKIKTVCENFYRVKRHEIGIFPNDRATMTFNGTEYSVSYHSIRNLMSHGTDVVFVEKQSTVTLLSPYTEPVGIAFIDSEGFGSEYGIALARICNVQKEAAAIYNKFKDEKTGRDMFSYPPHKGKLANITDCDVSGVGIGIKVNGSVRLGVDPWTIDEINQVNPRLDLAIEDLQETIDTTENSHYYGLLGVLKGKGKFYKSIINTTAAIDYDWLLRRRVEVDGEEMTYIKWLKNHRIELDTVLAAAGPEAVFNWLKWKLDQVWPHRDYNRAISLDSYLYSPTMNKFIEWYQKQSGDVIKTRLDEKKKGLEEVEGFYDDVDDEKDKIERDIIDNTMLPNELIKRVDLALEEIMK
jgi:hypothetical protein